MSNNEKEIETETETETEAKGASSRSTHTSTGTGADWEVVSLTASAYAASPNQTEPILDKSGQFVFPPSEHENLPLYSSVTEIEPQINEQETTNQEEEEEEELETTFEEEFVEREEEFEEAKSETEMLGEKEEREEGKREKVEDRDGIEWVKKRVSCFYNHVKEANTYWSVFVAATLVGLVILGHTWHREKSHGSNQIKSTTRG